MSGPQFVAIGEALTDMIGVDEGRQWLAKTGGSTWNVARAAASLGLTSAFAGAISRCGFGDALWRDSAAAGLDLRFLQRVDAAPLLAIVEQASPPRYYFIGADSADLQFDPNLLPPGWIDTLHWAHFGGISLAREPLAQRLLNLAEALHARKTKISFDPNFRNVMGPAYRSMFERMCRIASVIKVSDEDLAGLLTDLSPQAALDQLRGWNPRAWVLRTEGAAGASLITPEGRWHASSPPITVVDPVGAGDAAIAGMVASLLQRPQIDAAHHLSYAVAAGSVACTTAGANPPSVASVEALVGRIAIRCATSGGAMPSSALGS